MMSIHIYGSIKKNFLSIINGNSTEVFNLQLSLSLTHSRPSSSSYILEATLQRSDNDFLFRDKIPYDGVPPRTEKLVTSLFSSIHETDRQRSTGTCLLRNYDFFLTTNFVKVKSLLTFMCIYHFYKNSYCCTCIFSTPKYLCMFFTGFILSL